MFDRAAVRRRGQGGFTLLEAVIVVLVASVGIVSIAIGLQTAVTQDNRSNEQQRFNLAVTSFAEAVKRPTVWVDCECPDPSNPIDPTGDAIASTDPNTLPSVATLDPSPRHSVVRAVRDEPEVLQWTNRGGLASR